ncbi:MAG: hypothetical protein R8G01_01275 [Ilumatobacteraceae bacterium]|nr:hypothetical protein [Ilumatobacteraceae bacterium]
MAGDTHDATGGASAGDRISSVLSELEEADFELVDPPEDVWAGIEAAITSRPAPSQGESGSLDVRTSTVVEYSIDADDIVIAVGRNWADFARDNDAPELAAPPSNRTLWSYIENDEVRELWRLLVARVRASQQQTEVPLRCDAPHARRWLRMSIAPEPDGRVQFRCALVFEEARPPVSLLDGTSERDVDLQPVALCSWCGRVEEGSRWLAIEEFVQVTRSLEGSSLPPLAHGICGSCRDRMAAELLVPGHHGTSSA